MAAYEAGAFPFGDSAIEGNEEMARRPGAAPGRQRFGVFAAQLAHAVLLRDKQKWCGQPDLHRHRLNGVQASCSWTMTTRNWKLDIEKKAARAST